jgi:hypothetical protein
MGDYDKKKSSRDEQSLLECGAAGSLAPNIVTELQAGDTGCGVPH